MRVRWKSGCLVLALCVLQSMPAQARDPYTVAILPFGEKMETPQRQVRNLPQAVTSQCVKVLERYPRFDVLSGTELTDALTGAGLKADEVGQSNLSEVAEKLERRVVLYGEIVHFKLEKKVEQMVLFTRHSLVCSMTARVTIYDRERHQAVFSENIQVEGAVFGTESDIDRAVPQPEGDKGKPVDEAIENLADSIRQKLANLYKMVGQVTAVDDKTFTLDIGSDFGVRTGYYFAVFNPGADQRTAILVVTDVDEHSSKATVHQGSGEIEVGAQATQVFKR